MCMHLPVSLFQHMSIFIMNVMVMRVRPRNQMCDCVAAALLFFWLTGRTDCMAAGGRFHDSAGGCRGVAQNVWERICRAGRSGDSTGSLHGTCRNVCLCGGVSTFGRKGCTERVRTCRFYLSCSFFTAGLHGTCRNVCFWRDVSTFERKGCTERVGTYHFVIDSFKM